MDVSDYTPDTVCRSMGLAAFIEPDWTPPILRVLLRPSFHPEVCITLAGTNAQLVVVALSEMLWVHSKPCRLPSVRQEAVVPESAFPDAAKDFNLALAATRRPSGVICSDGMTINGCFLTESGLEQFESQSHLDEVSEFAAHLIRLAWHFCSDAQVRNALAHCAPYVMPTMVPTNSPR